MSISFLSSMVLVAKTEEASIVAALDSRTKNTASDYLLIVLSLGLYEAYRKYTAKESHNILLELTKAFVQHASSEDHVPVSLNIKGRSYEMIDLPDGGVKIQDCISKDYDIVENITLNGIRNAIMLDLMLSDELYNEMEPRLFGDNGVKLDLQFIRQKRANACTEATRDMIFAYHGISLPPGTNSRPIYLGRNVNASPNDLISAGLSVLFMEPKYPRAYTGDQLKEALHHGPMPCSLGSHEVVVHGFNPDLNRVDIMCPLMGPRCVSLQDFNTHLDWGLNYSNYNITPLLIVRSEGALKADCPDAILATESNKVDIVDKIGVDILKTGYAIGHSWLKSPEQFAREYTAA